MLLQKFKWFLASPKYSRLCEPSQSIVDFADPCKVIYLKTDISDFASVLVLEKAVSGLFLLFRFKMKRPCLAKKSLFWVLFCWGERFFCKRFWLVKTVGGWSVQVMNQILWFMSAGMAGQVFFVLAICL